MSVIRVSGNLRAREGGRDAVRCGAARLIQGLFQEFTYNATFLFRIRRDRIDGITHVDHLVPKFGQMTFLHQRRPQGILYTTTKQEEETVNRAKTTNPRQQCMYDHTCK